MECFVKLDMLIFFYEIGMLPYHLNYLCIENLWWYSWPSKFLTKEQVSIYQVSRNDMDSF